MPLPQNVATVLIALGYDALQDFQASAEEQSIIVRWAHADPQPTEQQLNDYASDAAPLPSGQLFSQWVAEHGGDALQTLRRKAKEALASQEKEQNAMVRAVVLELLNYANAERNKFNLLLQWLGTQTTLANRGQLTALELIEATPQQAKQAISDRITAGEAD